MSLSVLVYASRATVPFDEEKLKDLLGKARVKNSSKNITGMLLYREGLFVQALEGEEDDVVSLYERISKDQRHTDVIKIYLKPIRERSFGDWSMGFNRFNQEDDDKIEGYSHFLTKASPEFFQGNPSYAKALLDNFRNDVLF